MQIERNGDGDTISVRVGEAARMLGLSPRTLNNWRSLGKGPDYYHLGGVVVYPVDGLRSFAEERRVHPGEGR